MSVKPRPSSGVLAPPYSGLKIMRGNGISRGVGGSGSRGPKPCKARWYLSTLRFSLSRYSSTLRDTSPSAGYIGTLVGILVCLSFLFSPRARKRVLVRHFGIALPRLCFALFERRGRLCHLYGVRFWLWWERWLLWWFSGSFWGRWRRSLRCFGRFSGDGFPHGSYAWLIRLRKFKTALRQIGSVRL